MEQLQSHIWGRTSVSHIRLCNCSTLNFLIYEENLIFFFISHCVPAPLINPPTYLILWSIYVSSIHVSLVFLFMRLFFASGFSWISFPQAPDYTICHRCRWYRWCILTCEYLREFSKKFETVLMGYSGAGGKLIHEKPEAKKLVTLSLEVGKNFPVNSTLHVHMLLDKIWCRLWIKEFSSQG